MNGSSQPIFISVLKHMIHLHTVVDTVASHNNTVQLQRYSRCTVGSTVQSQIWICSYINVHIVSLKCWEEVFCSLTYAIH